VSVGREIKMSPKSSISAWTSAVLFEPTSAPAASWGVARAGARAPPRPPPPPPPPPKVWTGNDRPIVRLFVRGGGDSRWGL
jgi:hypothetical protein